MNKQLQGHLINYFRELMQSQKSLQCIRKQINQLKKYHPICIFKAIAPSAQTITIKNMAEFVKGKISCNERELYEIFQKFDHKRQGCIDKQDFCRQMHPNKKKVPKLHNNAALTYQVESKFLQYLNIVIKSCRVIDVWRKELSIIEPYKIFQSLDINLDGRIGPAELSMFFVKNKQALNIFGSKFLYQILLRRHYKQINLQVFCENLNPREFGGYKRFRQELQKQAEADLLQKLNREKEAVDAEKNYYKQMNNEKVVELVHQEASLLRQKQVEDRIKDELQVYQELKYLTRKRYHPQLTYQQFIRFEKQNIDRLNLQKQKMIEEAKRKQIEYQQRLLHVDAVRQMQAFERSKIERLPFMTVKNRIESNQKTHQQRQLEDRIKKHMINRLNNEGRTPLVQTQRMRDHVTSICGKFQFL